METLMLFHKYNSVFLIIEDDMYCYNKNLSVKIKYNHYGYKDKNKDQKENNVQTKTNGA